MTLSPLHRVALAVALPALAVTLYSVIAVCVQRQEIHECLTWQAQADALPSIQFAPWQFRQCDAYNISI